MLNVHTAKTTGGVHPSAVRVQDALPSRSLRYPSFTRFHHESFSDGVFRFHPIIRSLGCQVGTAYPRSTFPVAARPCQLFGFVSCVIGWDGSMQWVMRRLLYTIRAPLFCFRQDDDMRYTDPPTRILSSRVLTIEFSPLCPRYGLLVSFFCEDLTLPALRALPLHVIDGPSRCDVPDRLADCILRTLFLSSPVVGATALASIPFNPSAARSSSPDFISATP